MEQPLSLRSYPRAIIHIDADSFFASCEQAVDPSLKGKPVITGKERGIASAVSYEAKALGIKRGMSIREIKVICPQVIHLPSDYETYSLFSKRMFAIVRRYTGVVEEYSIDECFAELTGLRRPLRLSYVGMAEQIKKEMEAELGMTFSIGLAPSKVLAKVASKWDKPSGLVAIPGKKIHLFLAKLPVEDVWGIGEQTTRHLYSFGIKTALQLARREESWVMNNLTKPHQEIWRELRGETVLPIETEEKHDYQSISKTKTFTPPSSDRAFVLAQLSKNIENACIKARRHHLVAKRIFFLLRTQEYKHFGYEVKLSRPTAIPGEIVRVVEDHLHHIFYPSARYRLTGIVLCDLQSDAHSQPDLFGAAVASEKAARVYESIDMIEERYGKHTVFLGSSFKAMKGKQHEGERAEATRRQKNLFRGEGLRQKLGVPMLGEVG